MEAEAVDPAEGWVEGGMGFGVLERDEEERRLGGEVVWGQREVR